MSTQNEVEVSYDVSNDFFRHWLDERMIYSRAHSRARALPMHYQALAQYALRGSTERPPRPPHFNC